MLCRDGTYSAQVGRKSVWVFGDTCLSKGGVAGDTFIDNTLAWTTNHDASRRHLPEQGSEGREERAGALPAVHRQRARDQRGACAGNEIALWPGQIVRRPGAQPRADLLRRGLPRLEDRLQPRSAAASRCRDPGFANVTRPIESLDPNAPGADLHVGRGARQVLRRAATCVDGDVLYCYGGQGVGLATHVRVRARALRSATDKERSGRTGTARAWRASNQHTATTVYQAAPPRHDVHQERLPRRVHDGLPALPGHGSVFFRVAAHAEARGLGRGFLFHRAPGRCHADAELRRRACTPRCRRTAARRSTSRTRKCDQAAAPVNCRSARSCSRSPLR